MDFLIPAFSNNGTQILRIKSLSFNFFQINHLKAMFKKNMSLCMYYEILSCYRANNKLNSVLTNV